MIVQPVEHARGAGGDVGVKAPLSEQAQAIGMGQYAGMQRQLPIVEPQMQRLQYVFQQRSQGSPAR